MPPVLLQKRKLLVRRHLHRAEHKEPPYQAPKEKKKDLIVNDKAKVLQPPRLRHKTRRAKGKASSSQPKVPNRDAASEEATKASKAEIHSHRCEELETQVGRVGAVKAGAAHGLPQRHGGSKDDDIEGY